MDDLVDYTLKILLKIFKTEPIQLFTWLMETISDLNDLCVDNDVTVYDKNMSFIRQKQMLIEKIKEKLQIIEELKENKRKQKNKNFENLLQKEKEEKDQLDQELFETSEEEKNTYLRILKLSEFLVKYSKAPSASNFTLILALSKLFNDIIVPSIRKKEYSEVIKKSYTVMGLLGINYFEENKNFLKLFFEQIKSFSNTNFREFDMLSTLIIFDSLLKNNIDSEKDASIL